MEIWRPRCDPPTGLWRPVGVDATGLSGPTRRSAQRSKWRRTSWGQFVPGDVEESVEQRILEAWSGVPAGQVTGWAALRLYGGGFFEGLEHNGLTQRDVPILVGHDHRPAARSGVALIRCVNLPSPHWEHGIAVTSPARSVFEAMRFAHSERHAVTEVDMAVAAGITTIAAVEEECCHIHKVRGIVRVRRALALADANSRSPMETWLRLTWLLDANLPPPVMNRRVLDRTGRLVGVPDLLDLEAGVAGEYDGAFHRERERHRHDVNRWEGFRSVGIETFAVVAGDRTPTVVARMHAARKRALWLPSQDREWVVDGSV